MSYVGKTKILICTPNEKPIVEVIDNTFEAKQRLIAKYGNKFLRSSIDSPVNTSQENGVAGGQEIHLYVSNRKGMLILHTLEAEEQDEFEKSRAKMYTVDIKEEQA